ncbi:dihydroorotase [Tepidibacter hydrothermalis]|uniref:Dihydroorotase n=1 Tax=Tepidibacter hydrothermalis TaxID=3036126 RepID=A0ABY8ECH4_9FIRM|nr:dihydroorotase [Tepidibacter hydrothermalis]WFD09610.1 dihydroorotase [Tepidibacter hydrothermalis]
MKLLIKNARVINPKTNFDKVTDVLIENSIVKKIHENIEEKVDREIDASGYIVSPGFVDVHVHLREPGFEYKEDIETGALSAARGGFTTICAMPNTDPVIDCEEVVRYIKDKAKKAVVNVEVIGSITKGQNGKKLSDIESMKRLGIIAISEDGKTVEDEKLLFRGMELAKKYDIPVLSHCEDKSLAGDGVMNESTRSKTLNLKGISSESEEVIVKRDIEIAKEAGAKIHICHISTKGSVELVRKAKKDNIDVTCEVCPHHFSLADESVEVDNANMKMSPPLRSKEDVEEIKRGLKDGTIDIIATDHAPHHKSEKDCGFEKAANGIVGLETALSLGITNLVKEDVLSINELINKMSLNPSNLINIDRGSIEEGKIADITIFDEKEIYRIDSSKFRSKSKNTPFDKMKVFGKVKYTIVNGEVVYEGDED